MITHLIKSINWVDVGLALLFVRMIFAAVQNGFLSELFKLLGVVVAVFVSLHYYSYIAAWLAQKTSFTWDYWDLTVFALLWLGVTLFFRLLSGGILFLFKAEANHPDFNKYAAGIVAVGRGILVCSMCIFLILLTRQAPLVRMTVHAYSYKIAGRAAVGTYSFLYTRLVQKLVQGEHYNTAAARVLPSLSK
jgi:hypothetical protein